MGSTVCLFLGTLDSVSLGREGCRCKTERCTFTPCISAYCGCRLKGEIDRHLRGTWSGNLGLLAIGFLGWVFRWGAGSLRRLTCSRGMSCRNARLFRLQVCLFQSRIWGLSTHRVQNLHRPGWTLTHKIHRFHSVSFLQNLLSSLESLRPSYQCLLRAVLKVGLMAEKGRTYSCSRYELDQLPLAHLISES